VGVVPEAGSAGKLEEPAISDHSSAAELRFRGDAGDAMTFEFTVPGTWSPGLATAFAELMEKTLQDGFPIVVPVRKDATPERIKHVFEDVRMLVERAGLTPAQTVEP
jgi:hypothetical protein